jgi:hypothetical protein
MIKVIESLMKSGYADEDYFSKRSKDHLAGYLLDDKIGKF